MLSFYTTNAQLPAVLDFQFQNNVRDYVSKRGGSDGLKTLFENDDYYIDADSNAYALPTFIGNHDMGRFGYFLNVDNGRLDDEEKLARDELLRLTGRRCASRLLWRRTGLYRRGGDQDARQDMMPSAVTSYGNYDLIGTDATTADDNFDQTHPLYQLTDYAALRVCGTKHCAAVRSFIVAVVAAMASMPLAASIANEQIEYIVAFNNRADAAHNQHNHLLQGGCAV